MYNERGMRTTIEMKPAHRARLLEIAARRGEKGFSSVVGEAIEAFLQDQARQDEVRERALRAGGSFSVQEAGELRRRVAQVRSRWR